jgi:lipopolysaccharide export system permease protein
VRSWSFALLVQIIAPIALMIAVAHVLNKLGNDSELIVMNAAGMPPWILFRPFLAVGAVVSLLVAAISIYVSPWGLRELRLWATEVRADLVSNVVQPGRFTKLEERLTLHIREREPNGQLLGILIDDQRSPKERVTILAEKGDIVKNERGAFLVLGNGSIQRHETGQRDPALVLFESYGFDLSWLTHATQNVKYSVRERYLWELYDPQRSAAEFADQPNQVRAEFHDRITAPLYPLAFVVLTYAYLGAPRTTRQSRTMSLLGAMGAVAALRGLGFVGMIAGVHTPIALLLPYAGMIAAFVLGYLAISRGVIIEPPAFVANLIAAVTERLAQRANAVAGQTS